MYEASKLLHVFAVDIYGKGVRPKETKDASAEAAKYKDNRALLRGRVHRMESLISGLLEYSRAGRVKASLQQVDVQRLLDETIDLLAPADGAKVEVVSEMPAVPGDRLRLGQVFMNLISNALKHGRAVGIVPHVKVATWLLPVIQIIRK